MRKDYATTFTILCGTTMTFLGALPSSARCTASNSSTAALDLGISGVARDRHVGALLAVDLHRQGDGVLNQQRGLDLRPGRLGDQGLVAERRPAFLGQMRHHRREQLHHDFNGFAHGRGDRPARRRRLSPR